MEPRDIDGTSRTIPKLISRHGTKLHFKDRAPVTFLSYIETNLYYSTSLYFLFHFEAGFYVKRDLIASYNLQQIHGHSLLQPTRHDKTIGRLNRLYKGGAERFQLRPVQQQRVMTYTEIKRQDAT